eukprot:131158-Chlamydomonas_euryale.AAC.10
MSPTQLLPRPEVEAVLPPSRHEGAHAVQAQAAPLRGAPARPRQSRARACAPAQPRGGEVRVSVRQRAGRRGRVRGAVVGMACIVTVPCAHDGSQPSRPPRQAAARADAASMRLQAKKRRRRLAGTVGSPRRRPSQHVKQAREEKGPVGDIPDAWSGVV